jgi:acetyl esterase/lipase
MAALCAKLNRADEVPVNIRIVAAGKYLQSRADVNPARIGLGRQVVTSPRWALRETLIFAAGVDLHGVHDWPTDNWDGKISTGAHQTRARFPPVTSVTVEIACALHSRRDDRNVYFAQTVDLVARLRERGVHIEQLVFPDEIHDFLLHHSWVRAFHAASDFFDRTLAAPVGR